VGERELEGYIRDEKEIVIMRERGSLRDKRAA